MTTDYAPYMADVAKILWGEPNKRSSKGNDLRWGNHDSRSVNVAEGLFMDHKAGEGGGVLALIERETGRAKGDAVQWMRDNGLDVPDDRPVQNGGGYDNRPGDPPAKPKFWDRPIAATYPYTDEDGDLLWEKIRFDDDISPKFIQRRPDPKGGGRHLWNLTGVRQVPYHLPEILEAIASEQLVCIVEGEKDADNLWAQGMPATTSTTGAGSWPAELNEHFKDANIVLIPDNDAPGRKHRDLVGAVLKPLAKQVRVLDLQSIWADMPEKADVSDWLKPADQGGAAGTIDALYDAIDNHARAWLPAPVKSSYGAIVWSDLDKPGPEHEWLLKGLLTRGELSLTYGPSMSGKSFLALDMALSIARGLDYGTVHEGRLKYHKATRTGGVVYQAGEGGIGLKKRLRAYRQENMQQDSPLPFVLLPQKVDLFNKSGDTDPLIAEIHQWAGVFDIPLELVVVDTFATATPGANENASEHMSVALDHCAKICRETRAHVMLVHHMNAAGERPRGHTSILANVDSAISVAMTEREDFERMADGHLVNRKIRTGRCAKQKDGEDGESWDFVLRGVTIGEDADGDKITSCVVSPPIAAAIEPDEDGAAPPSGFKLNDNEFILCQALMQAMADFQIPTPGMLNLSKSVKYVVEYRHWRDRYLTIAPHDIDGTDEEAVKRYREAVKKTIQRSGATLQARGIIGKKQPYVWWTGKPIRGFSGLPGRAASEAREIDPEAAAMGGAVDPDDLPF